MSVPAQAISEKTIAKNVIKWGTGAINIEACRVGDEVLPEVKAGQARIGTFERKDMVTPKRQGRWPANIILDEEAGGILDSQQEGASRFFYCAKPSRSEKNEGCGGLEEKSGGSNAKGYTKDVEKGLDRNKPVANHHPTVKPIKLMQYLCRLATPEGGVVLDPFVGSGTTALACKNEGFECIGIEREEDYVKIARARLSEKPEEPKKENQEKSDLSQIEMDL